MHALPESASITGSSFLRRSRWGLRSAASCCSRDVRRFVAAIATSRESLVTAAFLTAVIGGVWVGMENGASVHTALLDARNMLFYAAFWPALAALARGRRTAFVLIGAGVVVVVGLQVVQELVGAATQVFLINPADISSSLTHEGTGFLRVRPPAI